VFITWSIDLDGLCLDRRPGPFCILYLAGQSQVVIVFAFALSQNDFWYNWYMRAKSKDIVERWVSIFGMKIAFIITHKEIM